MRMFRLVKHIRTSLWFVPVVCVLGGVALSFATIAVDRSTKFDLVPRAFTGGPDAAVAILETVAASMVTLTALVLTVTMVVVQLAMGQFSPRIVQGILRDKPSQMAIGIFVATFAHAMLTLREVQFDGPGQVPGVAIVVAFLLILISIVVLVLYVHHIGQALRVSALIELVGDDTRKLLDEHYPDQGVTPVPGAGDGRVVCAPHSGVVTQLSPDRLVRVAREHDCCVELLAAHGDFVPAGAPLFRVHGAAPGLRDDDLSKLVVLGMERTLDQDVAYGFRMLVDIAERSLSEGPFQDPTTAVQAIDRLHDCLRQLAPRPFPTGRHEDDDGRVRLVVPAMDWDAYVHLAFDEIRQTGFNSPQVSRRLTAALEDLIQVAPADRRPSLQRQLRLLRDSVRRQVGVDAGEAAISLEGDDQGLGVRASTAD